MPKEILVVETLLSKYNGGANRGKVGCPLKTQLSKEGGYANRKEGTLWRLYFLMIIEASSGPVRKKKLNCSDFTLYRKRMDQ